MMLNGMTKFELETIKILKDIKDVLLEVQVQIAHEEPNDEWIPTGKNGLTLHFSNGSNLSFDKFEDGTKFLKETNQLLTKMIGDV